MSDIPNLELEALETELRAHLGHRLLVIVENEGLEHKLLARSTTLLLVCEDGEHDDTPIIIHEFPRDDP